MALLVSQRGVVYFRKQDGLTDDLQKELVQRLGQLSGKPETSKLHIHPVNNAGRELGGKDDEISVISSAQAKKIYADRFAGFWGGNHRQSGRQQWHSDITFEPIPSDYALLRLTQLPSTGGGELAVPTVNGVPGKPADTRTQTPSGPRATSCTTASRRRCGNSSTG